MLRSVAAAADGVGVLLSLRTGISTKSKSGISAVQSGSAPDHPEGYALMIKKSEIGRAHV